MAQQEGEKKYGMPFVPPGRMIGQGRHCTVRELGFYWTLRQVKPFLFRPANWQEVLVEDFKLTEKYLEPYLPATGFVKGLNESGNPDFFTPQRTVLGGTTVKDTFWNHLARNENTVLQFRDFGERLHRMFDNEGIIPDIHGETTFNTFREYNFKRTDNVMIDPHGNVKLVDIERLGPLWRWPVISKYHMQAHLRSFDRFLKELNARAAQI